MLSKEAILDAIDKGDIMISPFDEKNLNGVSYDMKLSNILKVYKPTVNDEVNIIDTKDIKPETYMIDLNDWKETGIVLQPGYLYLGSTVESVKSTKYVPCISGRSTYARCGIQVHQTAFFANPGHDFHWVLEISTVLPVIIYPGMKLSQMYFEPIEGNMKESDLYHGRYEKHNLSVGKSEL